MSLLTHVVTFSRQFYFWRNQFFTLPQSNYFDTSYSFEPAVTSELLIFLKSFLFQNIHLFVAAIFSEQLLFQRKTSTKQAFLENRWFFRICTFWSKDFFGGENVYNKNIFRRGTFSNQVLLRSINFFRRVTFWNKLIFRKCNIPNCILFLDRYFFRVLTFLKDLTFHSNYFFRRTTFSKEIIFFSIIIMYIVLTHI